MKYENFSELIHIYKKAEDDFSELWNFGFDFFSGKYKIENGFSSLFKLTLREHYNEEGIEWVDWFIFDNRLGERGLEATDKNGVRICYDIPSLHKYLEENCKNE